MTDLPPFQTLPIHIAEAIVNYCTGLQRHRHTDRSVKGSTETHVWLVLHDVSSAWMQLARENLKKNATLRLSSNPENDKFTTSLHLRGDLRQSTAIIPRVKKVDIYFDAIIEEPNEKDLDKLGWLWPENFVFLKARSLNCHLRFGYLEVSNNARNDKYFKWFMERVRSSFPNLQEFKVSFGLRGEISVSPGVFFSKDWDADLFLSAFFRTRIRDMDEVLNPAYVGNEHILIENAPELASFCYREKANHKFAIWVIKKSAATLKKLDYGDNGSRGLKDFMLNDDGQVVVYPKLRDMRVFDSSDAKSELTTDKSLVPFPALHHLSVNSSCAFKDNTLFRGSSDSLISLDIGLHRRFVDIFRKYKVFSQGAYPNIIHVTARLDNKHGLTLPSDEFAEAAFGLVSPSTQSIKLIGDVSYQHIASAIPACPYLENIQILFLVIDEMSLLEILGILKYFPLVTDFGCSFWGIDSELAEIQDKLIPSHLGAQYSQLSSRLKCWNAYYSVGVTRAAMGVLFVTLAILCPNFTFVKECGNDREGYDRAVRHILSSGLYDRHTERLGQLFNLR